MTAFRVRLTMTFGKMSNTFLFGCLHTYLSKQKSPTAEIIGICFIRTIILIKFYAHGKKCLNTIFVKYYYDFLDILSSRRGIGVKFQTLY